MRRTATFGAKRPRRVPKLLVRGLLLVLVLAVLARLALPWVLPVLLDRVARGYGLSCRYDGMSLAVLGGHIELRRVELRPSAAPADEPIARLERLTLDLNTSALLTGRVHVHRAELDGLDLILERDDQGRWRWTPPVAPATPTPPAVVPVEPLDLDAPLDLTLPVAITALRLQDATLRVRDAQTEPPLEVDLHAHVRLSDLGSDERPARLSLLAHAPGLLDGLYIEGSGSSAGREASATLRIDVKGLHPLPLAPWCADLGLVPHAERIDSGLRVALKAKPHATLAHACSVAAAVEDLYWQADGAEALALAGLVIDGPSWSRRALALDLLEARGLRLRAARLAHGALRLGGIEFASRSAAAEPAAPASEPAGSFAWQLREARVEDAEFAWHDAAVGDPVASTAIIDELVLRQLADRPGDQPITALVRLRLPAVAEHLEARATWQQAAGASHVTLELDAAGLTLAGVTPYLRNAGLEPTLQNGALTLALEGTLDASAAGDRTASLQLRDLQLHDGEPLLSLAQARIEGLVLDPHAVRIATVGVDGVRAAIARDAHGAWCGAGVRTVAAATVTTVEASVTAPPESAAGSFELGELRWRNTQVAFVDAAVTPPLALELGDLTIDIDGLALGAAVPAAPARVRLQAGLGSLAESIAIEGTVLSKPGEVDAHAKLVLAAEGLSVQPVAAYLAPHGITPELRAGALTMAAQAHLRSTPAGWYFDGGVSDVTLRDGDRELFQLPALQVRDAVFGAQASRLGSIEVEGPVVHAARTADGVLHAVGLAWAPAPAGVRPPAAADATTPAAPASRPFELGMLSAHGLALHWHDAAVQPSVSTVLRAQASLGGWASGGAAPKAVFAIKAAVEGAVEQLALEGEAAVAPGQLQLRATLAADGLRQGPCDAYLPAGWRNELQAGALTATLEAELRPHPAGGQQLACELRDVRFSDRDRTWLGLTRLAMHAPRLDWSGGVVHVAQATCQGLTVDVHRTAPEVISALGFGFGPAPALETPGPLAAAPPAVQATGTPPPQLPRLQIDQLDLELAHFGWQDLTQPGSTPAQARLRLYSPAPLLLAPATEGLPPLTLKLEGEALPLARSIQATLTATIGELQPHAELQLELGGLRGQGLTELLPDLAQTIDGRPLADGVLRAKLAADLLLRRKSPFDFDLARGFGLELVLEGLELRDRPGGAVLAALDSLVVDAPRIVPGGEVRIRSVEGGPLRGRAVRTTEGLEILGLRLKPAPAPPEATAAVSAATAKPEVAASPAPELRLDSLVFDGLDFQYEDRTADPPSALSLVGLHAEAEGLTTRALVEPRRMPFHISLDAGLVELPKRKVATLVTGLLGAAADAALGKDDRFERERRPLFDQCTLQGDLALFPKPRGVVKFDLGALELTSAGSLIRDSGVVVGDGVLDAGVKLVFADDGALGVDAAFKAQYLSVDEPPGGPISTYLKLPAPLDTVLFVLRNEKDEHQIPLAFSLPKDGMSLGAIAGLAVTTFGKLLADAIAAAPLRAASNVTSLVPVEGLPGIGGLFGGASEDLSPWVTSLGFAAGDPLPVLGSAAWTALLGKLVGDDSVVVVLEHELGGGDLARAEVLANPPVADCLALSTRLRQEKAELQRARDLAAAQARTAVLLGAAVREAKLDELRRLDRGLATTETALDATLDLTRPGAERGRASRTRAAALDLARHRLRLVQAALLAAGMPEDRIEVRRPRFVASEGDQGGSIRLTPKRQLQ